MANTLKRKIEEVLTGYLKQYADDDFAGLNITQAATAEEFDLPVLVVTATQENLTDEMPPETGVREVIVSCQIQAAAGVVSRAEVDGWLACLQSRLYGLAAIQAYGNRTAVTDLRTVQGVHIYDCFPNGNNSDTQDDAWVEEIAASVTCGLHDAF